MGGRVERNIKGGLLWCVCVTLSLFAARGAITLIGVVENEHAALTRAHKTELSRLFISRTNGDK